jgi:hypothetical protein
MHVLCFEMCRDPLKTCPYIQCKRCSHSKDKNTNYIIRNANLIKVLKALNVTDMNALLKGNLTARNKRFCI